MTLARRVDQMGGAAGRRAALSLRVPRRFHGPGGRRDRRAIRRVAAGLCLILALYCLVAAAATLSAQTVPGEPDPKKLPESPRHPLPLLIPLVFLAFLVVVAAVTRRGRKRSEWHGVVGRRSAH